jgi:hypothetical protein
MCSVHNILLKFATYVEQSFTINVHFTVDSHLCTCVQLCKNYILLLTAIYHLHFTVDSHLWTKVQYIKFTFYC